MLEGRGPGRLDVIVIGAGAAGLAAWAELDKAGVSAICLEARDRIGGRILTVHEPDSPLPIELGAEFIHGKPRETWNIVEAAGLAAYDCTENAVHVEGGRMVDRSDAWLPVDEIMSGMEKAAEAGPDRSFADFLFETAYPEEAKKIATSYIEGFNAAHADRIGIQGLALDSQAADAISGDRSFRLAGGYDGVPRWLLNRVRQPEQGLHLNCVVEEIRWSPGKVAVSARSSVTGRQVVFESRRVIVTAPLGVLQARPGEYGAIRFDPVPAEHLEAARRLCFGQVFRTVLRFKERLWERVEELSNTGFLLSDEPVFPTWWTTLPFRTGMIVGWSAGRRSDPLLNDGPECVVRSALKHLARILSMEERELDASLAAVHFHNWSVDPFARGAYSYVPVNGVAARELLAQPVENTLYFSGEATETNGHGATVHGAIASGKRAARQILEERS